MTRDSIFARAAADPILVKGIYDSCDQWCTYCPATQRCLAYRCNPDAQSGKQDIYRSLADRLYEGIQFLKRVSDAEGRPTPEIDAILSNDPRAGAQLFTVDDPIERMGRRYAAMSDAYLVSRPDYPFEMKPRPSGPTALEVFAWFHTLVPAKIYRALVSAGQAARGDETRAADALVSAKVALIGIDRSLDSLTTMILEGDDARLGLMQVHLQRMRREVDARFPDVRSFVREGLDDVPRPPENGNATRPSCSR